MALLFDEHSTLKDHVRSNLADDFARRASRFAQGGFNGRREKMKEELGEKTWESCRDQATAIRNDVLEHLDYYLAQFIKNAERNGFIIHFAKTDKDAQRILLDICHEKNAKSVVKSKSMVSEEIDCNPTLLRDGIEVNETDLGEYMVQLNNWDHPSHLIMPGMHMDIKMTYDLFVEQGYDGPMEAESMTLFARAKLREKFLHADIGITGCNYGIASTGTVCILTNEGNGRMVTTLPETQVVLMGMERLLPNLSALDAMMQIFVRTAVGTKISSYMSFTSGPRTEAAQDGPKEVHIIMIDNGRMEMLGSKYREMLRCVRCGTCQNVCPVFRHITGHGYGTCYQGPMGIVYTPLLHGFDAYTKDLPFACTLCGACSENCPVEIPLHELILAQRGDIVEHTDLVDPKEMAVYKAAGQGIGYGAVYRLGTRFAANPAMRLLAKYSGADNRLDQRATYPILSGWTASKNLPLMRAGEFIDWWKQHQKEGK